MGCSDSSYEYPDDAWESAQKRARTVYNYRLKHYNPSIHGPYHYYMLQVEAEYELECIPEYMRRGNNYY
jgi:hypothetical protein